MTSLVNLIRQWQEFASGRLAVRTHNVTLTQWDAARIAALAEMYPRRSESELISELLSAALDELEQAMPYIPGTVAVSEDEEGNPIFSDVGPTPRFMDLSRQFLARMEQAGSPGTMPESRIKWLFDEGCERPS